MTLTKEEYIAKFSQLQRKELLKSCRMAGLTAHKLSSNEDLAMVLYYAARAAESRRNSKKHPI